MPGHIFCRTDRPIVAAGERRASGGIHHVAQTGSVVLRLRHPLDNSRHSTQVSSANLDLVDLETCGQDLAGIHLALGHDDPSLFRVLLIRRVNSRQEVDIHAFLISVAKVLSIPLPRFIFLLRTSSFVLRAASLSWAT